MNFPYRIEKDLHGVYHVRKLTTNECVGCIEADLMEILRGYFAQKEQR